MPNFKKHTKSVTALIDVTEAMLNAMEKHGANPDELAKKPEFTILIHFLKSIIDGELNIPNDLVDEVLKCKDNNQVREVGVEWSRQQVKELIEYGAPCIHFYTMGKSDNVQKIVGNFV